MRIRIKDRHGHWIVWNKKPSGEIETFDIPGVHDSKKAATEAAKEIILDIAKPGEIAGPTSNAEARRMKLFNDLVGRNFTTQLAIEKWRLEQKSYQSLSTIFINKRCQVLLAFAKAVNVHTKPPHLIEPSHVAQWINGIMRDRKVSTRLVAFSHLVSFFDWCQHNGFAIKNPARIVKRVSAHGVEHRLREKKERKIYTPEEIAAFCKAADELYEKRRKAAEKREPALWNSQNVNRYNLLKHARPYQIIKFAFLIGCKLGLRLGDICMLEHQHLSTPGFITVWTHKRDKRVQIPLTDEMMNLFANIPIVDDRWLFPEAAILYKDCIERGSGLCHYMQKPFVEASERAGIKGHSFHDTRATAIYHWKQAGVQMPHIAKLVGHSSEQTTRAYIHGAEQMEPEEIVYEQA